MCLFKMCAKIVSNMRFVELKLFEFSLLAVLQSDKPDFLEFI